jgi:hypothetical protein
MSPAPEITDDPCSTDLPALLVPVRLETRRIANDLYIRVFPDQPFIDGHRVALTEEEHAEALKLRAALAAISPPVQPQEEGYEDYLELVEVARGEWRELARRYGPNRAAWLLESTFRDQAVSTSDEQKAFVPRLFLLPERFVFLVYKDGVLAYQLPGVDITGELTLLPAPVDASTETGETPDEETPPEDGLFDAQSKWVTDFAAAELAGLAIKIPLSAAHAADPALEFSQIVVVGLRSELESNEGSPFAQFVRTHRYTDGFEFLSYSTPTNSTEEQVSGHSESAEELLTSYDYEVLSPLSSLSGERRSATAFAELSHAVGLFSGSVPEIAADPEEGRTAEETVLARIKGAGVSNEAPLPHMVDALWPSTGDYFYGTMLGYETGREMLGRHAARWLRPHGPLPTMRIGNQPYSVLPATRVKTAGDAWVWKEHASDHPGEDDPAAWTAFDAALAKALSVLLRIWLDKAGHSPAVPVAAGGGDQDEEVLQLLGMSPHSLDYRVRPIVDQTLVGILLLIFGGTHFGRGSSFEGLVPERMSAIPTWVSEKEKISDATLKVLAEMGGSAVKGSLLWRAFAWGEGGPLEMPLVRDPNNPADGPENYLPILHAAREGASPSGSNTLLYDLIRRSYQRVAGSADDVRGRVHNAVASLASPGIEFFGRVISAAEVEALARRAPKADPFPADDVFEDIAQGAPYTSLKELDDELPSSASPELRTNLIAKLRSDLDKRFELGLRDVVDALTYRLDAWYTTLATQRLHAMRARAPRGVYWGAYGYVEGLKVSPPGPPGGAAGGGFIHAPSVAHASAAAVLRSAFEAHRYDEDGNAYALNLTSGRVDRALALIDGVQQGQDLPALLGYQFERRVHDEGLDRVIDVFRAAFPISEPDEEEDTEASAEAVAARNVCDGRKLAAAYVDDDPAINDAFALADLGPDDRSVVRALIAEVADSNDAVGDVLLFEGVYQAVQGNVDRSGAALDASAGQGKPPDLESMSTPGGGHSLRHRVCLFLPGEPPDVLNSAGARERAEPRLNAWLSGIFGPLSDIACQAYVTPPDGSESALDGSIDLGALEPAISPLDFLYMCAALPDGAGGTEIELRLRRYVRSLDGVAPQSAIRLALGEADGRSVADAMELGRALLEMLGNVAPITPASLMHPDEAPSTPVSSYSQAEVEDFVGRTDELGRAEEARDRLGGEKSNLEDPAKVLAALDICAGFGIGEALVEREDDPSHVQRGKRVRAIVEQRLLAAGDLIEIAKDAVARGKSEEAIEAACSALRELFGASFITLPAIDVRAIEAERLATFESDSDALPTEDRVWLWLHQVADTHPRVRHFETAMMAAHAWGSFHDNPSFDGLKVAQLTPGASRASSAYGWQALSDDELRRAGTPGRVRGAQSVVAMVPARADVEEPRLRTEELVGFVIDEWTEKLAASTVTTGISFEYDQPSSQAPQSFLLAVPGNFDQSRWSAEHLAEIVRDTVSLARARLVDLDALATFTREGHDVTGIFPALMFPISPTPPTFSPVTPQVVSTPAGPLGGDEPGSNTTRTADVV